MRKIAIVTDSTAVMGNKFIENEKDLYTVPLQILFGEEEVYRDGIDLTSEEFFTKISNIRILPTTSQPSVGAVLELFNELVKEYDEILYITISSNISGTYNTGLLAANQLKDKKIEVFDSLHTAVIQKMYVEEALKMAKEGTHVDSIIKKLKKMRKNSEIYLVVDNLRHLGRTGRVNNMGAIVGALLKIKPILTFEEGYINLRKKVRTLNRAYLEVVSILGDRELNDSSRIMIAHANGIENAIRVKEAIEVIHPDKIIEIDELSPVIGVHTGPNTVGVAWIK
ncbi:DegV domain-containing protein [Candidatus Izimaplasma bacterium HR1]|jgi:DegV family protein with EDD domain|uniref:DegV family protein n=1 Tax=Candidatus Izimoplasma sp. HR1 TaxID=1541959 RepID=UPI0004F7EB6C|nr:DegV domain-containing protein [Candidatus Izimaplasma bacterium HR1]